MIHALRTGPLGVNTYIVELNGTSGIAGETGGTPVFITDPASCAFCRDEELITTFLKKHSYTPVAIVLTHGHFDHVAGLKDLRSAFPDIPVLIHKDDASFIGKDSATLQSQSLYSMGFEAFLPSVSDLPEASSFLEDSKNLFECSGIALLKEWNVIHTPGHTPGSVCLHNKREGLLLSGDTVFYRSWGRTDLPLGNEKAIVKSLNKLYTTIPPETKVYPGHEYYGFEISENY